MTVAPVRLMLAAMVVLVLLVAPSAASAQQANAVIAFSDSRPLPSLEATQQLLNSQRAQACKRAGRPRKMSLRVAHRSVNRYLRRNVKRRALRRLARSRDTRTAQRAEGSAVAALGANSPGAALAALLIANRKAPRSGRHLISASAVLGPLGRANEAIAFARAGERRARRAGRQAQITPFGIPQRALALNARGYALITLGRHASAVKLLRQAARSEPLFTEPRRNLAAAYLCQGRGQLAAQTYREATHRQDLGATVRGGTGSDPIPFGRLQRTTGDGSQSPERYPPEKVFDLSHGAEAELPPVEYPETPEAVASAYPAMKQQQESRFREAQDLLDRSKSISPNIPTTSAGAMRWSDIWNALLDWEALEPALVRDRAAIRAQAEELLIFPGRHLQEAEERHAACNDAHPGDGEARDQCFRDWCVPKTAERHAQWLGDVRRLDGAMRAWGRSFYRRQTGLAANFADEASRDAWVFSARGVVLGDYSGLLLGWGLLSWGNLIDSQIGGLNSGSRCFKTPEGEGGETDGHGLPSVPACSDTLNALSLNLTLKYKLAALTLSVACEQVSATLTNVGPLGAFASVSHRYRTGGTTVYAGGRGGVGGVSGDAGFYLDFDRGGNLTDLGGRAGAGAGVSGGPIGISGGGGSFNWSAAPYLLN